MSYQNGNVLIQQFIDNYGNTGRTYKAIDYVRDVSAANNSITLDPNTFLKGPGKKRSVRITYFPLICEPEAADCTGGLCDAGEVVEPAQKMFDITRCIASKIFAINKDDIRYLDATGWTFSPVAMQIMNSALPGMRRALAIDWVTLLYTMAGVHLDGNATHRVSVTNPANGVVNPIGKFDIEREYLDGGFMTPYILGGSEVYNWQNMVQIGGVNAQGQLINKLSTANSYYDDGLSDQILNDLLNGGHILSIDPQVFKYVWYLENAGIFSTDIKRLDQLDVLYARGTDGFIEGTLIDPVTGIPWDLYVNYDKCDQQWTFQIKHRYDFFQMPDVACNTQGVNGIMKWRTCPPVIAACPEGDTPSPAVTASTWSWTPGGILPRTVYSSTIGGVETTENTPVVINTLAELAAYMSDRFGSPGLFSVNGSDIEYTGYSEIEGTIITNSGTVTLNFSA